MSGVRSYQARTDFPESCPYALPEKFIVQIQPHEPAKQNVVVDLLDQSRSLRTEYSICNSRARSNCSGGIDGRPTLEYILLNSGESSLSTLSTIVRIGRSG